MLLLKDGVKYIPYEYISEQELATMVVEHYKELFGANTLFFDAQTMKTQIGISARSDGMIVELKDVESRERLWYILEVELAQHPIDEHIIPQITRFNMAYQQPETRKRITEALYNLIRKDPQKNAALQAQRVEDIHGYLAETIETRPTIAVVIDEKPLELEAVCNNLPFKTKATEFRTYTRETVGMNVHIHAFDPIYEKPPLPNRLRNILTVLELFYKKGETYDESVKIAAKKFGLAKGTIRAACTKEIELPSKQFRNLLNDKEKLRAFIIGKFPDYEEIIRESF